ncbi:FecR family protein [Pedobacter frigoris]|uniref:FecR family protein n=1 Tax=Pedobacter frigoris TaxID=2571272 RepID=UPI00292CE470|nr:FecR domain-containing protein [Pedobacter frigoris]
MQYSDQLLQAIDDYLNGKATATEHQMVNDWYHSFDDAEVSVDVDDADYAKLVEARLKLRVYESTGITVEAKEARTVKLWPRIVAVSRSKFGTSLIAAAAVAFLVLGVYFFNYHSDRHPDAGQDPGLAMNDIAPGKNGATITLANGKVIQLSDAKTGVVIGEDLKYSDGEILRDALDDKGTEDLTASTAKGQTYEFTLPDGTHVWLNADSKISFPSQFIGKTRKILLEGEAYFEVAKNKKSPFVVKTREQEVMVLGTHFNINSYADESSVKTTLFEGSVNVSRLLTKVGANKDLGGKTLKPGQQSILNKENFKVIEANMDEAIDWKNGDFVFKGESLESVMRRVARWYDVEVSYSSDELKNITVGGFVSRSRSISAVLELMERTGKVNFKIEGRKIIVTKLK